MNLTVDHAFAALVAVPCIIAMVKASDGKARVLPAIALIAAACAILSPVLRSQAGTIDIGAIAWVTTGVLSIIAGVKVAQPVYTTLMITGGCLGALVALNVLARH